MKSFAQERKKEINLSEHTKFRNEFVNRIKGAIGLEGTIKMCPKYPLTFDVEVPSGMVKHCLKTIRKVDIAIVMN